MSHIRALVLIFLYYVGKTVSDTTDKASSTDNVKLQATPSVILPGLHRDLTIDCTFLLKPTSGFSTLTAIKVFKSDEATMQPVYTEIASVSDMSRDKVMVNDNLGGARVSGQLSNQGVSFISFQWTYPGHQATGTYKCEVYGMDATGHPIVSSDVTTVKETETCCPGYLEKFTEIDKRLDEQKSQLESQSKEINALKVRMEESHSATFEATMKFNNHTYYLSRPAHWDTASASSSCRLHGGHLVQIDSLQEWNAIRDFLVKQNVKRNVAIGGADDDKENTFQFLYSDTKVGYFNWHVGEPTHDGDCIFMNPAWAGLPMHDAPCTILDGVAIRFVCEVPRNVQ